MKTLKEQGINTPKDFNFKNMKSQQSLQNILSQKSQGIVNQQNQASLKTIMKSKQSKPFSSFILSKYQQMDEREFKKIPISFIKQIYEKNSIDLRKVNLEGNQSKLNNTRSQFNANKTSHDQTNKFNSDSKNINSYQQYIQMSKSQIQQNNKNSYYINKGFNQSADILNIDIQDSGMNDSNSFSNSPVSVRSSDQISRSFNNNQSQKFTDQFDIIKEDNNSEFPSSSNLQEQKIKSQQSNHSFKDNKSHWKMKDQITSPTQVNKMINSPKNIFQRQSSKNEFQDNKQILSAFEQCLSNVTKQQSQKQMNFPTLKSQETLQKDIFSKTETHEFFNSQANKGITQAYLQQSSMKQYYTDRGQSDLKDQILSAQRFFSKQYSQMNSSNKKQANILSKTLTSMRIRTKTEGNEDTQMIGMKGEFHRANSNSMRDDSDSNIESSQQISKYNFSNESNHKNKSLIQRQNSSSYLQQGTNPSLKYSANLLRLNSEIEEDYQIKNKTNKAAVDKLSIQFLTKFPFSPQEGVNIKSFSSMNRTFSQSDSDYNNLTFNKKTSSAIQNFQKLSLTQNSFMFKVDEQKEKLKNAHLKVQQEKKTNNQNLFIRKSLRVNDPGQSPILEIDDLNPNKSPLLISGIISPNEVQNNNQQEQQTFPDFNLTQNSFVLEDKEIQVKPVKDQQNNKQLKDQADVESKDLKILESKFVLHKPQNHNRNREYIKSIQLQKNNLPNTSIDQSLSPTKNKKRFSLLQPTLQVNDHSKKDQDLFGLNLPLSSTKNKSYFAKNSHGNSQQIFNLDAEQNELNQNSSNNDKNNILNNQKNKNESEEIKTPFVKQLLNEQTNMYEENLSSLEHKLFQKKKQENKINLINNNNNLLSQLQNDLNTSFNNKNQHLSQNQEIQSPASPSKQKQFGKMDISSSASKGQFSPKNPNSGFNFPTTIIEKFQQEEKLLIRRSSLRLTSTTQNEHSNNPLQINGFSEALNKNNQNDVRNRSQFSLSGQNNLSTDSPGKKSQIPIIEIQISNKDQIENENQSQNLQKTNSRLFIEQPIPQKRNSRIYNIQNSNENNNNNNKDSNSNNINENNTPTNHQKQQVSMFSKMFSSQADSVERRVSKIGEIENQNISQKSLKNNKKQDSNSSQSSIDSDCSDSSRKSSVSNKQSSKKNQLISQINKVVSPNKHLSHFNFELATVKAGNEIYNSQSSQSSQKTPLKTGQIFGFSESIKSFNDTSEQQQKTQKETTPKNRNDSLQHKQSFSGTVTNQGVNHGTSSFNQNHEQPKRGSLMRFQSFDQRKSLNSPRDSPRNQNVRPSISDTEQSSKQKGFATIQIELKEIMDPYIIKNIDQSQKVITLVNQHNTKMGELKKYYQLFLEIALLEEHKVFNIDIFAGFKMHHTIFEELQMVFIETLKSLNYNTHAIEQIIEKLEKQKKLINQGQIFNELGGSSGIHKLIVESIDQINQKIPYSFANNMSTEQKTSTLTRLITIICNYERVYSSNANYFTNQIDQKSSYNTEVSPLLHNFKDFGPLEFYSLKIIFWTSLKSRGYRYQTIFRFLEQFEKIRYKIQQSITMQNLLCDKQQYDQINEDYLWKIQCDPSLTLAFESNNELITHFCHANVLEFIYNIQGKFDLGFILSKLTLIQQSHIKKLENLLIDTIQNRGLSAHHISDVQIKFIKLSYKLKLVEPPLSQINNQEEFFENLINEIDSIMHSDQCFEEFIKKFPEDKLSLTLGDKKANLQTISGLHALSFFIVTLLSEYDVYRIQDLHSLLQAYNISITIPIQWKIAIEFSLNNLNIPSYIANKIIQIISEQFSILYKNTQYESFNRTLLN